MRRVWAVLRVVVILVLALLFVKNKQPQTLHLYLGYSLTLPFFLWLVFAGFIGLLLGYTTSRLQFRHWKRRQTAELLSLSKTQAVDPDNTPRISSVVEALRAVPASPKGEDEHRHYGI